MSFQDKLAVRMCLKRRWKISACTLGMICSLAVPVKADSIAVTYSFAGATTGAPVVTFPILTVDGLATGSVLSSNPSLNTVWNPVTFNTVNVVDLTTGLNNGTFSMTFADGDTLFGNLFEDDSALGPTNTGPFTQTLTFTGGTGEFLDATGSVSGGGDITSTGFTTSGSGTINTVPEPASGTLLLGGLALGIVRWRARLAVRPQRKS
jgi:hypothetical protein